MIEELKSFSILFFQRCSNQGHINTTLKMLIWVILWKELIFDHFVLLKKVSCKNWMVLDDLRRFSEQIKYHIINNTTKELFGDGFFLCHSTKFVRFFFSPLPHSPHLCFTSLFIPFCCSASLRLPKHPFISLYTSQPLAFLYLLPWISLVRMRFIL